LLKIKDRQKREKKNMDLFTVIAVAVVCYTIYAICRVFAKAGVAKARAAAGIVDPPQKTGFDVGLNS